MQVALEILASSSRGTSGGVSPPLGGGVRHPPPPVRRSPAEHHLSLSDALSGARIPRNLYTSTPFFRKSFHSVRTELWETKIGNHPNPPMILPVTFVQCLFPVILAHSGPAWAFGGGVYVWSSVFRPKLQFSELSMPLSWNIDDRVSDGEGCGPLPRPGLPPTCTTPTTASPAQHQWRRRR